MKPPDYASRPLSYRHTDVVRRLINTGHRNPDGLFIAADAYDEFAAELRLVECQAAAAEAQVLADRLRAAAERFARGARDELASSLPCLSTMRPS